MSSGKSLRVSVLLSLAGYAGSFLLGGSVLCGLGEVRANTRAAATASA